MYSNGDKSEKAECKLQTEMRQFAGEKRKQQRKKWLEKCALSKMKEEFSCNMTFLIISNDGWLFVRGQEKQNNSPRGSLIRLFGNTDIKQRKLLLPFVPAQSSQNGKVMGELINLSPIISAKHLGDRDTSVHSWSKTLLGKSIFEINIWVFSRTVWTYDKHQLALLAAHRSFWW